MGLCRLLHNSYLAIGEEYQNIHLIIMNIRKGAQIIRERYQWIDIAKGIGIILVVIGHATSIYMDKGIYLDSMIYKGLYRFIYSFHMPMFMIISGTLYGIRGKKNLKIEMKRNIIAYGIPYVIFSLWWGLTKILLSRYIVHEIQIKDLFLILVYPIVPYWFIYAILLMNLIQTVANKYKENVVFRHIHILLATIGYFMYPFITTKYSFLCDSIFERFLSLYIFYVLGVYLGHLALDIHNKNYKIVIVTLIEGIIWFLLCEWKSLLTVEVLVLNFIIAIIGSLFALSLSILIQKNYILEYIGKKTLPIYLLHTPSMLVGQIIIKMIGFRDLNGVLTLTILVIFGVGIPLCIYFVSKKIMRLDFIFYPTKYLM